MAVTTTKTNKPLNPRGNDQSPKGYNRASLFSGKALDFDGVNDEVNCGNIDIAFNEISFAFHFNADSFSNNTIFQKESVFRFIGVNTNQMDIVLATTGNSWYSKKITLTNLESKDYFLVATYNGSELKAYLNGVLVDTLDGYSGSVVSVSQNVYFGRTNAGAYYDGKISGARIFNTALTAAQVSDLYNNPEKIVPTGVADSALKLWLPMMEGAGTTAYDGSGNGNHGAVSGASWLHGIGAPVAQTAVIDWNKGTNLLVYSEQFDDSNWAKANVTITANATTAPDGQSTADEVNASSGFEISDQFVNVASATHIASFWFKNGTINQVFLEIIGGTPGILGQATINLSTGTLSDQVGSFTPTIEAYADGWYRVAVGDLGNSSVASPSIKIKQSGSNTGTFYIWGAQIEAADSLGAYIPNHTGTPITSDVLLPQGLTTGRDITGVNLFENVRKQSALNLDGNSWAEVHDNASLDIANTDDITMELWFKRTETPAQDYIKWMDVGNALLNETNYSVGSILKTDEVFVEWRTSSSGWIFTDTDVTFNKDEWVHLVVTIEMTGANSSIKTYKNGVLSSTKSKTTTRGTGGTTRIGRTRWNSSKISEDNIAQPRIYNRALTAEEVARNYSAGKNTYTND